MGAIVIVLFLAAMYRIGAVLLGTSKLEPGPTKKALHVDVYETVAGLLGANEAAPEKSETAKRADEAWKGICTDYEIEDK